MAKNLGVGGFLGGNGEGLPVGLKEVLPNCSVTQKGKAGLGSGCAQLGRRTAGSDWGIVEQWKEHFKRLLNLTNTSSVKEAEAEYSGKPHQYLLQRSLSELP